MMRKNSLPKPSNAFTTRRLLLRVLHPRDALAATRAIRESFRELHPWMPWAKRCPTVAETRKFCREAAAGFAAREHFQFFLFTKSDNTFIGCAGLIRGDESVPKFEIGYWIHSGQTGQGLATEAVEGLTRFARRHLKVRRLEIRMDTRNLRSRRVAERAGYQLEGVLRQNCRDNRGKLRDTMVFSKVF